MNEYDESYRKGRADWLVGKRRNRPRNARAWRMFKAEEAKRHEEKLNRSYDEGYETERRER